MRSWVLPGHARESNFRRFVHCPQGVHAKCGQIWPRLPSYSAQVIELAQSGHRTCFFHRLVAFGRSLALGNFAQKHRDAGAASHKMARVVILDTGCLKSIALFKSNQRHRKETRSNLALRYGKNEASCKSAGSQANECFFRSQLQGEKENAIALCSSNGHTYCSRQSHGSQGNTGPSSKGLGRASAIAA